jgi:hypothetical protein
VTLAKTHAFPPLCVKCGGADALGHRTQLFTWFPSWTYLLLFVGLLPAVIVQTILTKRAKLDLPICRVCGSEWKTARLVRTLAFVIPIVVGLGLAFVGSVQDSGPLTILGFLLFFPGILVVIPIDLILVRRRTVRATFVDDRVVTLKGISPVVLEVLPKN